VVVGTLGDERVRAGGMHVEREEHRATPVGMAQEPGAEAHVRTPYVRNGIGRIQDVVTASLPGDQRSDQPGAQPV
jgi:hypothetical protein